MTLDPSTSAVLTPIYTFDGTTLLMGQDENGWTVLRFEDAGLRGGMSFYYDCGPSGIARRMRADIGPRIMDLVEWRGEDSREWMIDRLRFVLFKGYSERRAA